MYFASINRSECARHVSLRTPAGDNIVKKIMASSNIRNVCKELKDRAVVVAQLGEEALPTGAL